MTEPTPSPDEPTPWTWEERQAIDALVAEWSLYANESEVERWLRRLMAGGKRFEEALGEVELLFSGG